MHQRLHYDLSQSEQFDEQDSVDRQFLASYPHDLTLDHSIQPKFHLINA